MSNGQPTDYPAHPQRPHRPATARNVWIAVVVALLVPGLSLVVTGARLGADIESNTERISDLKTGLADDMRDLEADVVPRMEIDAKFEAVKSQLQRIENQNQRVLDKLDGLAAPLTPRNWDPSYRYAPPTTYSPPE